MWGMQQDVEVDGVLEDENAGRGLQGPGDGGAPVRIFPSSSPAPYEKSAGMCAGRALDGEVWRCDMARGARAGASRGGDGRDPRTHQEPRAHHPGTVAALLSL